MTDTSYTLFNLTNHHHRVQLKITSKKDRAWPAVLPSCHVMPPCRLADVLLSSLTNLIRSVENKRNYCVKMRKHAPLEEHVDGAVYYRDFWSAP